MIRTVITESSRWEFDLDKKQYRRTQLEDPRFPNPIIAYTGEWEPYEEIEEIPHGDGERRLLVHRPVPWGTGARRHTGVIVSDETTN